MKDLNALKACLLLEVCGSDGKFIEPRPLEDSRNITQVEEATTPVRWS
jgi:hypothetical protein